MTATLTVDNLHRELLRGCIEGPLTEPDALLWMVLLHTHEIRLHPGTVAPAGPRGPLGGLLNTHEIRLHPDVAAKQSGMPLVFAPLTQRDAAQVIADLWIELGDGRYKKADCADLDYAYWYWEYNLRVPYECVEAVPPALLPRLEELRVALSHDPRVVAVVPEY